MLLTVVTAGTPKVAVAVAEPPPPKLNNPAVADVVVGPVDVCDKEEDFVPKPKTFDEAVAAVVFGAEEFPKENKFAGAAAEAAGAVVVAPMGGLLKWVTPGTTKEKALLAAELLLEAAPPPVVVVVGVAPPKLKAGAGAEVVTVEVFDPANWKLGAVLAAAVLLPPKLNVSEGAETELEVEATVEVGPRPNDRVLAAGVLSG